MGVPGQRSQAARNVARASSYDAGNMLDDALAIGSPRIDAEKLVLNVVISVLFSPQSSRPRFKEKPQLPKRAGLELDSVRPLQSPVSPLAQPATLPADRRDAGPLALALLHYRR